MKGVLQRSKSETAGLSQKSRGRFLCSAPSRPSPEGEKLLRSKLVVKGQMLLDE
jgi:hypothetical protein